MFSLQLLWEEAKRYSKETSIHGFRYIAAPNRRVVRALWVRKQSLADDLAGLACWATFSHQALVVVTGFACTYLLCTKTMREWEERPFSTSTETIPVTDVQFPTVTVCRDPHMPPDRWSLVCISGVLSK